MTDESNKETRHQTEPEGLRASEIRYRRLFESARDGILILDAASRQITDVNPFMVELLGYSRDEFLGKELWEIGLFKDKDESRAAFRELQATGYIRYEDLPLQTKAGKLWNVEFISNVYREDGHQVIQCNIRDITERKSIEERLKQSEQWLRTIFEASHEGILVEDNERIHYVNKSYLRLFGYDDPEELVGQHISVVVSPEDAERLLEFGRSRLRGEQPPTEYEFKGRRKDGSLIDVEASISASNVADSTYITTMIRDITERKHAEILLDTQRQALEMVVVGSPLAEVLEYLARIVERQSSGSSIASILLLDEQGRLHTGAAPSLPEDYVQAIEGIEADESVGTCSAAAATGKTVVSPDIAADPKWKDLKHLPLGLGLRAAWSLPIMAADKRVLGTFGTYFREKRGPTKLERQTVEILAKTAALAIERKQAEEALRDAHERITNIFESITDCFYALDADWRFTYVNPQAEAYFNRPKETMLGRLYVDVFPLTRDTEALARLQEAMSEQKPVQFEIISPTTGKWVDLHVFPADGGLVVYFRDITERHRTEDALRESETRFRGMFEQANVGIVQASSEGRLLIVNPGFCKIVGYSEEETRGMMIRDITYPDDYEKEEELTRRLVDGEISGYSIEKRFLHKDGRLVWGQMTATLVRRASGEPYYLLSIVEDITERKETEKALRESEEKYRTLFESIDEGFCTIEVLFDGDEKPIDYRFLEVSPSFEGQTGIENAAGRRMREIAPRHEEHWFEIYGKVALTGEPVRFENRAEQLHRWYDVYAFRVEEPRLRRVGILFQDITGRKRAEEELKNLNEQLEGRVAARTVELMETNASLQAEIAERRRAERGRAQILRRLVMAQEEERRRIARDLHDQFGQQLTVLMLKLGMLKEDCGEQKGLREQVENLEEVASQLDADADFLVWQLRPTALDDLGLQDALTNFAQNWSKHFGIPVDVLTHGLEKEASTSEIDTVLYRIAQEALKNVAKHARAANVSVILEGRSGTVSLIIEDDGVGFDAESASGASDKRLGLVGMRERAALVGGTAEVESHPEGGTRVIVRIPAPPAAQEGEPHE